MSILDRVAVRRRGALARGSAVGDGGGVVVAVGFDHRQADAAAKNRLECYFPGRDVHVIEMLGSWGSGGGVHCHTNDQPALPKRKSSRG